LKDFFHGFFNRADHHRTKYVQPGTFIRVCSAFLAKTFIVFDTATFYLIKLFYPILWVSIMPARLEFVLSQWWDTFPGSSPRLTGDSRFFRRKIPPLSGLFPPVLRSFLPISGIVPFIFQIFSTVADRYLYLSMMGPAIAVGFYSKRKKI